MTSRFFMSDTSESSDSEVEAPKETVIQSNFMASLSDEEEDVKRYVRTAKEKRYEELNNVIKNIKNYKKNKDLANLLKSKFYFILPFSPHLLTSLFYTFMSSDGER